MGVIYLVVGEPGSGVGSDGDIALDAATGNLYQHDVVWSYVGTVRGPPGPAGFPGLPGAAGTIGPAGSDGQDGNSLLSGITSPAGTLGRNGDTYLNLITGYTYEKVNGGWVAVGNIGGIVGDTGLPGPAGPQGPPGLPGIAGPQGSSLIVGTGAPASGIGNIGDNYLNISTGDLYTKASGAWVLVGNLRGIAGTNGSNVLSGSGAPASTLGNNGDGYVDLVGGNTYSKAAGRWISVGNLRGYSFLTGTVTPQPTLGNNGDSYLNISTGGVYTKGSGAWALSGSIAGQWVGSAVVAPGAVASLTLDLRTSVSVRLTWGLPSSGGAPTGYRVLTRVTGASAWTSFATVTGTQVTVSGLTCFTAYDFEVIPFNAIGDGPASQILDTATRPMITAYVGNGLTGLDTMGRWVSFFGRRPEIAMDELAQDSWTDCVSNMDFVIRQGWALPAAAGSAYAYQLSISMPLLAPDGTPLSWIAGGYRDSVFTELAQLLVQYGLTNSIVRLGWDANAATAEPWAAFGDPVSYVESFRRAVGLMRAVTGANFLFEFCGLVGLGAIDLETIYPGDDVVDIIGLSAYNTAAVSDPTQRWNTTLYEANGLSWLSRFAAKHGKVIALSEFGTGTPTASLGGDDTTYTANIAAWIKANPVYYASWWDAGGTILSSGTSVPSSAAALVAALGGAISAPDLPAAPAAVTAFSTASASYSSVTIRWNAPASGGAVEQYILRYRLTGTTAWSVAPLYLPGGASSQSATISGLTALTGYDFEIGAANRGGTTFSAVFSQTTPSNTTPNPVTGLSATSVGFNTVQLIWANASSGGPDADYLVQYRVTGASSWTTFAASLPGPFPGVLVTGLAAGTEYDFQITAFNPAGSAAPTILGGITTLAIPVAPGAVTGLVVGGIGLNAAAILWQAPTTGSTPFTYEIDVSTNGGTSFSTVSTAATSPFLLSGLAAGQAVIVRVTPRNGAGVGTATTVTFTTIAAGAVDDVGILLGVPGATLLANPTTTGGFGLVLGLPGLT